MKIFHDNFKAPSFCIYDITTHSGPNLKMTKIYIKGDYVICNQIANRLKKKYMSASLPNDRVI